jgi:diaminopimelate epimerase
MINFSKYQGAGNDFILIDNRKSFFHSSKIEFAKKWCDRRFGIGSDGVIFIENSSTADFKMDFYNPDGSQSFCGNGSRCAVTFAKSLNIVQETAVFEAIDGLHQAAFTNYGVKVAMHQEGKIEKIDQDEFIHTGSPHYISYRHDDDTRYIVDFGRLIRYSPLFAPNGTNVNLIEEIAPNHIAIQTYERGVEDETFACGTGATACGLSYAAKHGLQLAVVDVDARGGKLKIHCESTLQPGVFTNIWLEGPAEFVYKGELDDEN